MKLNSIVIFLIVCMSCSKQRDRVDIALINNTPAILDKIQVKSGVDPVDFLNLNSQATSDIKQLTLGGREIVNPIMLQINIGQYYVDGSWNAYPIGLLLNRNELKKNQTNYIKFSIDSTKLPKFVFSISYAQ